MFIINPGQPISPADLQEFESKHSVQLAEDHRRFLLAFNGGTPYPNSYKATEVEVVVSRIFSLSFHPLGDLESSCSEDGWKEVFQKGLLRIADDLAGQPIMMSMKGSNRGHISIFIDGEYYFIASTFNDMLRKLEAIEGLVPSSFHSQLMQLKADQVASGEAGVYELEAT